MFTCDHCHEFVAVTKEMAVQNRNHCPFCLWSKHVDDKKPGDRKAFCQGLMEPIGLTFKKTKNKYKKDAVGELMLIHRCVKCGKIEINRIAADDTTETIMDMFAASQNQEEPLGTIKKLTKEDAPTLLSQLFGKKIRS